MFKLVVLSAIFAAAAAEPGLLAPAFGAPLAYSSVYSPGVTSISQQASSVVHPSPPLVYSAPVAYSHFIKKRSAPFAYVAPTTYLTNTRIAAAPLATTYSAPALLHSAPIVPAAQLSYATHFIKKRSAPLVPTTYIAPTTYAAATPLLTSTYAAAPLVHSAPLISQPITYSHFIKKRSAPLFNAFVAPSSYSTQSRVDVRTSPLISTTYTSPIAYSSPIAYTHVTKAFDL